MTIPAFDEVGNLPVGEHVATLEEVIDAFCQETSRRRDLRKDLEWVVEELLDRGVVEIWIDGSFVTRKARPGDIDIAYNPAGVDPHSWSDKLHPDRRKELYDIRRLHVFPSVTIAANDFQKDFHRQNRPKGIIKLS